jgi:hypothetical protein
MTNVSVMYRNAAMVAEDVMPPLPTSKQSDKYFTYGLDNLRADDDARRPGGRSNEIDWTPSTDSYYADGHALSMVIPDEWRENADAALDLDTDTTIQLTDKIMLAREINCATKVATLTAHAQTSARWDVDTTDPVKVIDTAKETIATSIGCRPTACC